VSFSLASASRFRLLLLLPWLSDLGAIALHLRQSLD
jgi:hypothetical protein